MSSAYSPGHVQMWVTGRNGVLKGLFTHVLNYILSLIFRTLQARSSRTNSFLGAPNRRVKLITLKIDGMKDLVSIL